jgi:hypothetical protein
MTTPTTSVGEDLLEALAAARWPDGSPLIDAAPEILSERLLPELLAAIEPHLKDQARA